MTALLTQYLGLTLASSTEKLYADPIIDARTRGMIVPSAPGVFSAANPVPTDTELPDLVEGVDPHVFKNSTITFDGTKLGLVSVQNRIQLGDNWKIPDTTRHLAIGYWFRLTTLTAPANPLVLAGHVQASPAQSIWRFGCSISSSSIVGLTAVMNGASQAFTGVTPDTELHRLVAEIEILDDEEQIVRTYYDEDLVGESSAAAFSAWTEGAADDYPFIGHIPPTFGSAARHEFYAAWMQDLSGSGRTLAEIMALDWATNYAAWSA
ncbi:hypothetical protein [Falsiroseomonas selenitidurans]|uniref:Uncharacterized protein n=1 Tax=Falsiroseomonas selenitidurans TaxID=2716335 RepID=A0ABX1E9L0_9PROT|nr:hypothetical protein [Falsiroseomonas selenitidurans]NKC33508.1 hypothetical protein [Falsiroseomonas selenitidurans]